MMRKSIYSELSRLRMFLSSFLALLIVGCGIAGAADAKTAPGKNAGVKPAQVSAATAARFLEQSSWGPTATSIAQVMQGDLPTYLQSQFSAPISTYPTATSIAQAQQQFFVNALTGQDQLRQRVSFALSEIMVVSGVGPNIKHPNAFSLWMNMLQNDAFGNFYTIINDVTLSPTMGSYLNMAENNGCAKNCRPNENYGRELLQLFTIGLYELNQDGTAMLDGNGNLIPTYDQTTIEGFGDLFTGWTYPSNPPKFFLVPNYNGPMIPFQIHYSKASKSLLNGYIIAPDGNIQTDLASGLTNVFTHPNVAPFICKQLIEKLVTSNPSPAYVSRCSAVFDDDGNGVAGDMQAIISEILLDSEARRNDDPTQILPSDGHLREPLLHMMYSLVAMGATTDGVNLSTYAGGMLQAPFMSPSVFNFYPPDYMIPGTGLYGPEFDIFNATTSMNRINFINTLIYGSVGSGTTIDISQYVTAAGQGVPALLNLINTNMMHGAMPSDMYNTLQTTLSSGVFTTNTSLAQAALYLVATSSQFQVED